MENMVSWKDLYDPLEHAGVKPTDIKVDDWKKLNRKAVGLIRQCIGEEVFHQVARRQMLTLRERNRMMMYHSNASRNKTLLMRRLVNLKLQSGNSVVGHSSEF